MTSGSIARQLPVSRQSQSLLLFSLTLFLSAAAMFMVQPMIGKMLLPLVGGTPAGWIVAMAFFQVMLLAGYGIAFLLSRLPVQRHGQAFIGLLLLGALFLPVELPAQAGGIGAWDVFRILAAALGVPFVALAATSSTVQRIFAGTAHSAARDPYFLYAASNLGSFAGLLLYPAIVETFLDLEGQSRLWLGAYGLLVVLTGICLMLPQRQQEIAAGKPAPVPLRRRLHWIALAFFPSSLMLGVTSHITADLISAPLVWVLPLALYLLTFVVAFSRRPLVPYRLVQMAHPTVVAVGIALVMIVHGFMSLSFFAMGWHVFAFVVVALTCHMRLAQLRPLDDERQLPDFYLMIALGGALGGMLNAFIAPALFDSMAEYPLVLLASCLVNPQIRSAFSFRYGMFFMLGAFAMVLAALFRDDAVNFPVLANALLIAVFVFVTLHPRATLLAGTVVYLLSQFYTSRDVLAMERNFYGVIRVYDRPALNRDWDYNVRVFRHGTTTHGTQILNAGFEAVPTAYFAKDGPLGDVFRAVNPRKVAVMGLGAGTIACHATKDSEFTFFEIDPAIVRMANSSFSYLRHCNGSKPHRIITGDGRLELSRLEGEKFDLIILDAFSSDMVPVHLVSLEALQLYSRHLTDGGVLAFNLSSRYLRLQDMLAAGGSAAGMANRYRIDDSMDDPFILPTLWLIMSRDDTAFSSLSPRWVSAEPPSDTRVWTDSYSSIMSIVRL